LAYASAYVTCLSERITLIPERHVKLFKNGRNQAVRIPREFELPGYDAIMRKDGDKLIIEAVPPKSLLALLATLAALDEDFPAIVDAIPDKVEI
jgi:antitoxin VapB